MNEVSYYVYPWEYTNHFIHAHAVKRIVHLKFIVRNLILQHLFFLEEKTFQLFLVNKFNRNLKPLRFS